MGLTSSLAVLQFPHQQINHFECFLKRWWWNSDKIIIHVWNILNVLFATNGEILLNKYFPQTLSMSQLQFEVWWLKFFLSSSYLKSSMDQSRNYQSSEYSKFNFDNNSVRRNMASSEPCSELFSRRKYKVQYNRTEQLIMSLPFIFGRKKNWNLSYKTVMFE